MATKSTLESANIALKAQNDALMKRLDALEAATTQPAKPAKPLVALTHMKQLNPATGKWDLYDESKPAVLVNIADDKRGIKLSRDNFEALMIARHSEIVAAYKKLS